MLSTVSPVIAMSPSVLSVIEDQPVTLPCVLLAGNPLPKRQWLHNYGLVRTQRGIWLLNFFPHLAHLDSCPGLNKDSNLHSVRWPQTSMCQWGGMAVCILREFGWMMRVTTPAWLRTLLGPPTTQPLSTFTVANIRTHKISTQTSAWAHSPPTNQISIRCQHWDQLFYCDCELTFVTYPH